jgi:pimeloyl-ACP methyl ester carboxylesterase
MVGISREDSPVRQYESEEDCMIFPAVVLLHGKGGSPNGSVSQLEAELRVCQPNQNYIRPLMPHTDPAVMPSVSVQHLRSLGVPQGTLIIGVSLGGLVAAKLQELERPDLHVVCISSPTHADDTELTRRMEHRVSLYSSADSVIAGRTERWPELAEAYDLPWLDHDTDKHKAPLGRILCAYLQGLDVSQEIGARGL